MEHDYELIDVCHTIEDGMITYKGLPAPVISDFLTREESRKAYAPHTEFHIGKIEMVANTGTYIDSPFHRYPRGADLSGLDLYSLANLDGMVVRALEPKDRAIEAAVFEHLNVRNKAVLLHTGWDTRWRTTAYSDGRHPFLTAGAAELLAREGAVLVGIDSFNIDNTADGSRPAHSILLAHGIPIVEHLCGLTDLPDTGFRFFAAPVKIKGLGSFPVRAFGLVPRG